MLLMLMSIPKDALYGIGWLVLFCLLLLVHILHHGVAMLQIKFLLHHLSSGAM
jgi:hypothetical protein